jgi:hypothetical protein
MNDFILNVEAGGVFSKFMFAIQNIQKINPNFNSVYINNIDNRSLTLSDNIFDKILDQTLIQDSQSFTCAHLGNYSKFNPIEKSNKLSDYRKIVKKIKINDNIINETNKYVEEFSINGEFIGLHIRLCDMNIYHGKDYGVLSFNDFLIELRKHISNNTKIFVASDNIESIKKLQKEFGNRVFYVDGFIRGNSETEDILLRLNNLKNIRLWEEAFIEMLLLSKCGKLICRTSNLNNASIIYSNTIKNVIRL